MKKINEYDEGRIEILKAIQFALAPVILNIEETQRKLNNLSDWAWELERKLDNE